MKNDLIERYIYAVTKQLPKKNREDVSMELRGLIDDMLSERCAGEPTEQDVRDVLTELGTPLELYAKYDEDADKCLIGQPYYSSYKLAMKAILAAIIGGLCAYPVAIFFMGQSAANIAYYAYIIPFLISTAGGAMISGVLIYSLKNANILRRMQETLNR